MGKFHIDTEAIRALAALLEETGLTEIEVGDKENRLRVARQGAVAITAASPAVPVVPVATVAVSPAADDPAHHPGALRSPMVGTVYLAPEPGAPSFVQVGDQVVQGQTLLIIEAMKVMNEIKAEVKGIVTQVLVENAKPVEFGQPLFKIRPI